MKTDTTTRRYRSDVEGTSVRMGIAAGAEAHIMEVLSKMYADPELAVIREYSTNAYDSHIEAGATRPIEVTLPTVYLPTLVIRDYGIGLDEEGIRELYSQYGASSKRETNSAQGMLGIGCKSALAYTDQFTIVGFKDGIRTQVVISRDEDGAATQTIVGVDAGDYENGVEVTIPVKSDNSVEEKARDFYRFWPENSVVFVSDDGYEEPRKIGLHANGTEDDEGGEYQNIWMQDGRILLTNEVDQDLVVMGYVAYPLVDDAAPLFDAPHAGRVYDYGKGRYVQKQVANAVCFVDIGDVNFAPSRESLMSTKRTNDRLDQLRTQIADAFDATMRARIANAPTARDAQTLLVAARGMGFKDSADPATWQGREVLLKLIRKQPESQPGIVRSVNMDDASAEFALKHSYLFTNLNSYTRKQGERSQSLDLSGSYTIFTNFDGKWMTPVKRAKLELWEQRVGTNFQRAVFIDKLSPDEKFWTNGWPVVDWADINAIVLPSTTTADGGTVRLKGSYSVSVNGGSYEDTPAAKIDQTKPIYYAHGNAWTVRIHRAIKSGAVDVSNASVVALSQNRIEKFKRDFPKAVELTDAAKEAAKAWAAKIDTDQAKAHAVQAHRAENTLKALKGRDFDDPSLNTLIRLATTDATAYAAGLKKFASFTDGKTETGVYNLIETIQKRYPLVEWDGYYSTLSGKNLEHTVLYLNAVMAAE